MPIRKKQVRTAPGADAAGFDHGLLGPSQQVLAEYGNMSSPTVLFVLRELLRSNGPGPTVMLGFGPGLAIVAALVGVMGLLMIIGF